MTNQSVDEPPYCYFDNGLFVVDSTDGIVGNRVGLFYNIDLNELNDGASLNNAINQLLNNLESIVSTQKRKSLFYLMLVLLPHLMIVFTQVYLTSF